MISLLKTRIKIKTNQNSKHGSQQWNFKILSYEYIPLTFITSKKSQIMIKYSEHDKKATASLTCDCVPSFADVVLANRLRDEPKERDCVVHFLNALVFLFIAKLIQLRVQQQSLGYE